MSDEDIELERLKAKRLAEMQQNITKKQKIEQNSQAQQSTKQSSRDVLVSRLGYRGLEVLENAESQFPSETKIIVDKISELITSGDINEQLDGGKLLLLFRSVGLNIRMKTKINIEQDGKFVSLSDKLSNKKDEE